MNIVEEILSHYAEAKEKFLIRKGNYQNLLNTKENLLKKRAEKLEDIEVLEQAKILLQESSRYAKEQVKVQLEKLVTSGLQYIFEEDLRFEIAITESGKARTEAEFYVVSKQDGEEIRTKPESARGGGIVDVVSLILRVAVLQSYTPAVEGPLILDEPVKMVSANYIEKVGEFLQQLNQYFGRQIIMATHNIYLTEIADKKYSVSQNQGISQVEEIKQ